MRFCHVLSSLRSFTPTPRKATWSKHERLLLCVVGDGSINGSHNAHRRRNHWCWSRRSNTIAAAAAPRRFKRRAGTGPSPDSPPSGQSRKAAVLACACTTSLNNARFQGCWRCRSALALSSELGSALCAAPRPTVLEPHPARCLPVGSPDQLEVHGGASAAARPERGRQSPHASAASAGQLPPPPPPPPQQLDR